MTQAPTVIVFDVNETLSDLAPLRDRFADVGAAPELAALWFAAVLRDGFALIVVGAPQAFAVLAEEQLRVLLPADRLDRSLDDAVGHVMEGFGALGLHDDVDEGVRRLHEDGRRLVTLSNGSTAVAERLLGDAGLRDWFEAVLSVEAVGVWKPHREAYAHATRTCGLDPSEMMLVAVHPWDVDGAARAGMSTAWLNRSGGHYPAYATEPTLTVGSLTELADRLSG